jgi:flavorubredoxin
MVTNPQTGTNVHEIADGIYRVSTPLPEQVIGLPGGFTFNQYLIVDDEPLLFHTGPRRMFPLTRDAVASVMPVERLRWVSFSHVESDESGALNDWLSAAPRAQPLCGAIAAMVSVNDLADRPPRALADGEEVSLGTRRVRWFDAPHLPHNWECGYLFEAHTRTLLCGDLLTQPGDSGPAVTDADVVESVVALDRGMGGAAFAFGARSRGHLDRLAACEPRTLACMHGSALVGDGGRTLRRFADAIGL